MSLIEYAKNKPMLALVYACSFVSAAMLAAALVAQYGLGMFPCELCLFQRVPYGIIALAGAVAGMCLKTDGALKRVAVLCALLFLVDAGIAGYHTGVEYGVFTGPSACTNNSNPDATLEEMREAIRNAQLVPCDQPMAHFLGLSMAAWNALAAAAFALAVFWALGLLARRPKPTLH